MGLCTDAVASAGTLYWLSKLSVSGEVLLIRERHFLYRLSCPSVNHPPKTLPSLALSWRSSARSARELGAIAAAEALLALALAVGSGKLMQEDWLRQGQLHHLVYSLHLMAWVLMAIAVAVHVVAVWQRGGLPLARSMASFSLREGDLPADWFHQIRNSLTIRR